MAVHLRAWFVFGFALIGCSDGAGTSENGTSREHAAAASQFRYHLVPIASPPAASQPIWYGVLPNGNAFGTANDCYASGCTLDVITFDPAAGVQVLARGFQPAAADGAGNIGGCTLGTDNCGSTTQQAAILHLDGSVTLLPQMAGERASCITNVSVGGTVYAFSYGFDGKTHFYVVVDGQTLPVEPPDGFDLAGLNDRGEFAGFGYGPPAFGFRYDARTGTTTVLPPAPCEPQAEGRLINREGVILGTSWDDNQVIVGTWNEAGEFSALLTGRMSPVPALLWNEAGLLVVDTYDGTYLVPEPGVKLELASVIDNGPLPYVIPLSMNEHGDLLVQSFEEPGQPAYLLLRED